MYNQQIRSMLVLAAAAVFASASDFD